MDYLKYYSLNKTFTQVQDDRIKKIVELVEAKKNIRIADIGCGDGLIIRELQKKGKYGKNNLIGVDVYDPKGYRSFKYVKADITAGLPFEDGEIDTVILGEVLEHVPNPDFILKEINRILRQNGTLIISTPNIVSWANRILVPLGIQPLFTETSTSENLGRYFSFLGQGKKVQGHLKIFTHRSLEEILLKEGFEIAQEFGVPFFFPFPLSIIDKLFCRIIALSSGLLYVAKKR